MSIEKMKQDFLSRLHERLHHYLYVDPKDDPNDKSMIETYELIEMGYVGMNEILDEIRMALEDEFPDLTKPPFRVDGDDTTNG